MFAEPNGGDGITGCALLSTHVPTLNSDSFPSLLSPEFWAAAYGFYLGLVNSSLAPALSRLQENNSFLDNGWIYLPAVPNLWDFDFSMVVFKAQSIFL